MSDHEISGQGYSRGGSDKCPDVVPLWMTGEADPTVLDFSGLSFDFRLIPQRQEIRPGIWVRYSVEDGMQIWDFE